MDYVDFLRPYSCDPLQTTALVEQIAVGADVVIVAVDHLVLCGYSKFESYKSHVVYVVCVECAVFLAFLDFLRFVVDLASLDYFQQIVFFAFAWVSHRPWDYVAQENQEAETLEDDECCLTGAGAWEMLTDGYATSDLVVDTAISLANQVGVDESLCSQDWEVVKFDSTAVAAQVSPQFAEPWDYEAWENLEVVHSSVAFVDGAGDSENQQVETPLENLEVSALYVVAVAVVAFAEIVASVVELFVAVVVVVTIVVSVVLFAAYAESLHFVHLEESKQSRVAVE